MVKIPENKVLLSKELRKKQTPWEKILWDHLRANKFGAKFKRQVVIAGYIVDFACKNKKLVIELDGFGHHKSDLYSARTRIIERSGYKILRFWNSEVEKNLSKVLQTIERQLRNSPSPPTPLPSGRGEF